MSSTCHILQSWSTEHSAGVVETSPSQHKSVWDGWHYLGRLDLFIFSAHALKVCFHFLLSCLFEVIIV